MSRKLGLLIIFILALIFAVGLHLLAGGSLDPTIAVPAILGKAIGLFLFPGILPCVVWAFMKFRRERLRLIMTSWIVLQIILVVVNYLASSHALSLG
jgi:hypothetical protein